MKLRKGDVCFVNLGGVGHEQSGNRPAIVLAATRTKIAVVIPVTANTEALRFVHTLPLRATMQSGLQRDSVALLFHIRAIDERRVEKILGRLSPETRAEIDQGLRKLIDL